MVSQYYKPSAIIAYILDYYKRTTGRLLDGREWNEMPEVGGGNR